jgi:predicted transposase/invertase (TIGR01784 family)
LVFAINEFHKLQKNSTFRQEILKREEILREEASALASAQNWGIDIGLKQGIEIGNAEGRFEQKRETAIELLKLGLSLDQISTATRLNIKEIEKLKEIEK